MSQPGEFTFQSTFGRRKPENGMQRKNEKPRVDAISIPLRRKQSCYGCLETSVVCLGVLLLEITLEMVSEYLYHLIRDMAY